jgi:hypothetical protein
MVKTAFELLRSHPPRTDEVIPGYLKSLSDASICCFKINKKTESIPTVHTEEDQQYSINGAASSTTATAIS